MKINLEENLVKLQEVSEKMEQEDITLEESLKLFEMGIKLYRESVKEIEQIKHKVSILIDGVEAPFDEEGIDS